MRRTCEPSPLARWRRGRAGVQVVPAGSKTCLRFPSHFPISVVCVCLGSFVFCFLSVLFFVEGLFEGEFVFCFSFLSTVTYTQEEWGIKSTAVSLPQYLLS